MSIRISARFLLVFCFVVVALASSAALATVPVDYLEGFQPRTIHHVQMLVITEYFHVTPKEFRLAARKLGTADEMTVAFFVSRESGKKIKRILRRRASGASWWVLMKEYDVRSSGLYRESLQSLKGMKEGNVPLRPWPATRTRTDTSLEDLVGAKVTAEYFETAPSLVLDARAQGRSFREIQYAFYHMGRGPNASLRQPSDDVQLGRVSPSPHTSRRVETDDVALPRRPAGRRPSLE
jgi:hypothetical protein